jgi:hypothetical protein
MQKKIYKVVDSRTNSERLIRAVNKTQALRIAAESSMAAGLASQDDIVTLVGAGVVVEGGLPEAVEEAEAA